ncbi:MAG: hypothetical protein HGB00_07060 [Chlorobiaceae bacterium]|nr:hypothetical protein [Chlorobiaceae bacterium]
MKCPSCSTLLLITERQGIEIDYCPECRGVWLDRGELDKLIEKSAAGSHAEPYAREYREGDQRHGHGHDDHHDSYVDPRTGRRKRKEGPFGFLGDLFD